MSVRQKVKGGAGQSPLEMVAQVLGRDPEKIDWLSDIELRIGLIFYHPGKKELQAIFGERYKVRLEAALIHWAKIVQNLELPSEKEKQDISRFTDALHRSRGFDTAGSSMLSEAIYSEQEIEVEQLISDRQLLATEWNAFKVKLDRSLHADLIESFALVEQATAAPAMERGSLLREARNHLAYYSAGAETISPVARFLHGWAVYQIGQDVESGSEILVKLKELGNQMFSSYLAFRLLAKFSFDAGNQAKMGLWTRCALDLRKDPECLIEAALQMSGLADPTKLIEMLTGVFLERPGLIVKVLSDPRSVQIGTVLSEIVLRVITQVRQEGERASVDWASTAGEIESIESQCGLSLNVPYELQNGYKQVMQRIECADLITAGYVRRNAVTSAESITRLAQSSLMAELNRRRDAVSIARRSNDSISEMREDKIAMAREAYEQLKSESDELNRSLEQDTKRSEKIANGSMGSGAGLFFLYIVASGTIATPSLPIGPSKPLGMMIMLVSTIPLFYGAWMYFNAFSIKSAAERKLHGSLKNASKSLDQLSKEADDSYRDQLGINRKVLAEAEQHLQKAEKAAKLLKLNEKEFDNAVPGEGAFAA